MLGLDSSVGKETGWESQFKFQAGQGLAERARGSVVGALCYKPEGRGFEFR
jgi:hypothetical protein